MFLCLIKLRIPSVLIASPSDFHVFSFRTMEPWIFYASESDADKCDVIITRRTTKLCKSQAQRNAFLQLGLIVLSFAVGYLPISAYYMWSADSYVYHYRRSEEVDCGDENITVELFQELAYLDYLFGVISYICMRLSECMNPLLYCVGSRKLRVEIKSVFSYLRRKCICF